MAEREKALIVVESPTKIKTLQKFLGKEFLFASSLGHIRDLPEKGFGIDIERDFEPQYEVLPDKKEVIANLVKLAKQCDVVYLSPDPDREGEAIAWHIASLLPKGTVIRRAAFNAITKEAVRAALAHPAKIDEALVNAQQARRLLDRIVGYKISPLLARRIQRKGAGLSAGRVQSVALKLVVDREKAIEAFRPVEYWNVQARLEKEGERPPFIADLYLVAGRRCVKEPTKEDQFSVSTQREAEGFVERLKRARYSVATVEKREKRRNPEPPFITSTLQQEASRHFRFSTTRTMSIAQALYEGMDLGNEGTEGLITYMRTDSVRVAEEALQEARRTIVARYGQDFLPETPRFYTTKKSAQDAHEAIRPTNLAHPPEKVRPFLSREEDLLYTLIWNRFIASQMASALYDTVSVDIATDQQITLRATGSQLRFKGYLAVYEEKEDEEPTPEGEARLPELTVGDPLKLLKVTADQSFTKPPPRFTDASLVKELEKSGIGRPSTYATIMNKIQSRAYTVKEQQRLKPTELGRVIAQFLEENFAEIMNVGFTAAMEDELEEIAANKKEWKAVIRHFWEEFFPTMERAEKEAFVPKVATDLPCPKCGKPLQKIWSKARYFFGCSGYPECDYTSSEAELAFKKEEYAEDFAWEQPCPKCGGEMKVRHGRFGAFLGCLNYPECKGLVNIPKRGAEGGGELPACPAEGCDGRLTQRRSRFGKPFYSCSNYPDCDVIVNRLEQLEEKYQNHPKTPYVKKERKTKKRKK